ncbi:T9SS type A sorting domain-containing protein [Flammeovirga pectinis]|uniref:T9SS type A sorting domain-containing protein n=1 Tax=Flammeovirga pectinis TaxID=2494373 RepID=A0A3S9PAY0_9BACT|nr:T9SS type A sorting domain-containing protein [Flammeovirga pectinis]AZQ65358.1 T9SS type A sorting domain-containing protein [Flammeovirga pectinis]
MKKNLTAILLFFCSIAFAQNTVYQNNFDVYTSQEDMVEQGDFILQELQDLADEQEVTLVIGEEDGNKFISFDTPGATTSKNTNIRSTEEINFKAGVTYTLTAKARGPFARGLRIINTTTNGPAFSEANYNARNDETLRAEWYEHSLEFTPEADFIGIVAMFRGWNSTLDIDDILLVDNQEAVEEEEEVEEETPVEEPVFYLYQNDFAAYSENESLIDGDFKLDVFQLPELERTLETVIDQQDDNQFLQLQIIDAAASANTLVSVMQDIQVKAGIEYTLNIKTRGAFRRDIRILEKDNGVMFESDEYNATNDATLTTTWYQHTLVFTPETDFTAQVSVLRLYYGSLDIDDIMLSTTSEDALNQETPLDPDALYHNNFASYTVDQDLNADNLFSFVAIDNEDGERTLTAIDNNGNKVLKFDTPNTTIKSNTNIIVDQEIQLVQGRKYMYSAITKGKFDRDLKVFDTETNEAIISSENYNAGNDDIVGAEWHEQMVEFTAEADLTVQLVITRKWNGLLEVDDIKLVEVPLEEETEIDTEAIYHNNFAGYDEETLITSDFDFVKVEQEDTERTIVSEIQDNNNFLRFDTPSATGDATTYIYTVMDFEFKAGTTYTLSARTRGQYMRGLKVLNSTGNTIVFENRGHNAGTAEVASNEWYTDMLVFTPETDFTGKLAVNRDTNGILDIDDLLLSSFIEEEEETPVDEEEEEETPVDEEEEEETPVDEEEEEETPVDEEEEEETPVDEEEEEETPVDGEVTAIDPAQNSLVSVYPSPTTSSVTVDTGNEQIVSIVIANSTGKIVQKLSTNLNSQGSTLSFKLNNALNNGVYIIKINCVNNQFTKRVVLNR